MIGIKIIIKLFKKKLFINLKVDSIPGIGPKSIEKLIACFGTMNKIKLASKNELEKIVGDAKSNKILKYYSKT